MPETEIELKLRFAEWRPIDTAPRDGTKVDVWFASPGVGYRPNVFWDERMNLWCWEDNFGGEPVFRAIPNIEPTHWLPASLIKED